LWFLLAMKRTEKKQECKRGTKNKREYWKQGCAYWHISKFCVRIFVNLCYYWVLIVSLQLYRLKAHFKKISSLITNIFREERKTFWFLYFYISWHSSFFPASTWRFLNILLLAWLLVLIFKSFSYIMQK
jgi:hypothetical protein